MRILCVCTGNTCRSPMLAALLDAALRQAGVAASVESAGTGAHAGDAASSGAQVAMRRRSLDLGGHASRPVQGLDLSTFNRIYTVSARHSAFVRAQGIEAARIHVVADDRGGVPDPWGGDDAVYEETARTLEEEVARNATELSALH